MTNYLIPIGGVGQRFKDENYKTHKALLNILTKPCIRWVIDSLLLSKKDKLYITYNSELKTYNFEYLINLWYPDLNIHFLCVTSTKGASDTIFQTCKHIDNSENIICIDSDIIVTDTTYKNIQNKNFVTCFYDEECYSTQPPYSYVDITETNMIKNIVEKNKITNFAVAGIYGFETKNVFLDHFTEFSKSEQDCELYTSNFILYILKKNFHFIANTIDPNDFINIGTPLHLHLFSNNYPMKSLTNSPINTLELKRICFDLDNTLVTAPTEKHNYRTVKPIQHNINLLNYLHKLGHTIIIHTARRMKTFNGNVGKVIQDVSEITLNTLKTFNIYYDELYFGKPFAHIYIDDLAINANLDLEKELGCYLEINPRSFNTCVADTMKILRKSSKNGLASEIYFYENIPNSLKDMFPIFLSSKNIYEYEIEFIKGITLSKIYSINSSFPYINEVLKSINRMHSVVPKDTDLNPEDLYENKLKDRYIENKELYDRFENSKLIFNYLYEYFTKYKNYCITMIHGDPVFSNIIINNLGKFKFIDIKCMIMEKFINLL